jgi:hypothetical protein
LELTKDRAWLARVSTTIYQHWQKKNFRLKETTANGHALLAA